MKRILSLLALSASLFIFLFVAYVAYSAGYNAQSAVIISPIPDLESSKSVLSAQYVSEELQENRTATIVSDSLRDADGEFSVYIKNLKTDEVYQKDANTSYESASLYKLWVMASVFQKIQNKKLAHSQILSQDILTLNKKFQIDSEFAELPEGVITQSVDEALEKMITISDNYSAMLLSENVRLSTVSAFLKETQLFHSSVGTSGGSPVTTASDIGLFLEKLYYGEFANQQSINAMLALLKNQKLRNGIPKLLPKDIAVANKTGELGEYKHDAAIVFSDTGDYIIVVLSKSEDPTGAQRTIARLSKAVYDHFGFEFLTRQQ